MIEQLSRLAASLLLAAVLPAAALAAPATPGTAPTTRILAIGTLAPGADVSEVQKVLPSEVRATVRLYLDGKIDQWFSLTTKPGVVFILNENDPRAAAAMLEALPLGQAHLMTFELTPLGPLNPLRQLIGRDSSAR
jgi:hypothetical protein